MPRDKSPNLTNYTGAPPPIQVSVQQSRFAKDAVDAPKSKEIDIADLSISIGKNEILDRTRLRIREGVRYVLAGRNGTGKSTILRALAEGLVPGVPANLRLLLLGQTFVTMNTLALNTANETHQNTKSVLEYVITSNATRERTLRQAKSLSAALDGGDDDTMTIKALREVKLENARKDLLQAQQTASRRSGVRGSRARQLLIAAEKRVEQAEQSTNQSKEDMLNANLQQEVSDAVALLDDLHLSLDAMDSSGIESRARKVLFGLGFSTVKLEGPVTALSGGWRTRCELACALTQRPDVLLLDEPTNFLDLMGIVWLQQHLVNDLPRTTSVVVVTHDREFADAVAEELILLKTQPAKTIETFRGTLTDYMLECGRQIKRMTRMKEAQERQVKHMEASIAGNVKAAKRSGDDKKLKQAVSRKKKIEDRSGMEVSAKGTRFKRNRDMAGYFLKSRLDIEIPDMDPPVSITLPDGPDPSRINGSLVSLEKVSFRYQETASASSSPRSSDVLHDINLVIHPGERIGIMGQNGTGKSTLVNLIMSSEDGMKPRAGEIKKHARATFSLFSQHAVDALQELGEQQPSQTALGEILGADGAEKESTARALLAGLGLRGKVAAEVPLRALSGGQKVRVGLAKATMNGPDLLVLDEVTTHLDAETIVALVEALEDWRGALLVVTHDRAFMRAVVEGENIGKGGDGECGSSDDEDSRVRGGGNREAESREPGVVYRMTKTKTLKRLNGGVAAYEDLIEKAVSFL